MARPESLLPLDVTPSDTTVTLPTPTLVHAPLAMSPTTIPPRFIFYPISWDGSQADLDMQPNKTAPPDVTCSQSRPYAELRATDTFSSIDRWRRDVVNDTADLLDPIHDADTPLLSFPHDHYPSLRSAHPEKGGVDRNDNEDEIQLWIHP